MKEKCYLVFIFLLAGILIEGCKSLQPQMPVESYRYVPAKPRTSIVNLHADLEVAKLEAIINSQVDSVLYEDKSFVDNGGDNLMLKALKNGEIKMAFEDDILSWEIPLRVSLKKTYALFLFKIAFYR